MNHLELVRAIERRYRGGRERLFIVHGNTSDLFPFVRTVPDPEDTQRAKTEIDLLSLPDFLYSSLAPDDAAKQSRIWIHHVFGRELRWINRDAANSTARVARMLGSDGGLRTHPGWRPTSLEFFRMVDEVCMRRERATGTDGKETDGSVIPLRIVATEAHAMLPNASMHFLRPEDRALLVQLRRFASEPMYDETNTLIILVTDALTGIHPELLEFAVTLEMSRPDEQVIGEFLAEAIRRYAVPVADESEERLRKLVIGLSHQQVDAIAGEYGKAREMLTPDALEERRRQFTRRDFSEFLEFTEPQWTLDDVGGAVEAVADLRELAASIRRGDPDVPAGIIIGGPNGVGKTHLLHAFAGTVGITAVTVKSFKQQGYGETERAQAKIITALTSSGQGVVIVEEADGTMGQRTGPNVHPVDAAVLTRWLALIGDQRNRGKLIWLLDTCRPDKLAPDLKRPGRCERVIPLFPETTTDGIRSIMRVQTKLLGRQLGYRFVDEFVAQLPDAFVQRFVGKTGAQIKRTFERARKKFAHGEPIAPAHLEALLQSGKAFDVEKEAWELQRLIGLVEAIETDNVDLIPQFYLDEVDGKYHGIDGVKERIAALRRRIDRE